MPGQHPAIVASQQGATAHRIDPRVKAPAHILHYLHSVSCAPDLGHPEDLSGVRLTQSAITQDAMKQSEGTMEVHYEALRASVQQQAMVKIPMMRAGEWQVRPRF